MKIEERRSLRTPNWCLLEIKAPRAKQNPALANRIPEEARLDIIASADFIVRVSHLILYFSSSSSPSILHFSYSREENVSICSGCILF
jgi:hypothetical protein